MAGGRRGQRRGGRRAGRQPFPPTHSRQVRRLLLDCALELSHKAPAYACVAGMLNGADPTLGSGVAADAAGRLQASLDAGDPVALRLAARFAAATKSLRTRSISVSVRGAGVG